MTTPYTLLLVENDDDPFWASRLTNAMSGLANIARVSESELLPRLQETHCDLILVDAVSVSNVVKFVQRLKKKKCEIPIVVITASPTPEIARSLFRAGAADYIRQSLDEADVRNDLLDIIKRSKL